MGHPSLEEKTAHDDPVDYISQALCTSTSLTGSLSSPNLRHVVNRTQSYSSQLFTPRDGASDAGIVVPAVPGEVRPEPIMTPRSDDAVEPTMNLLVGGALAPVQSTAPLQPPPPSKAGPGLRLPSFQELGIAAPHPDRVGFSETFDTAASRLLEDWHGNSHRSLNDLGLLSAMEAMPVSPSIPDSLCHSQPERVAGRAVQCPVHHYVNTLTPPPEVNTLHWDLSGPVQTTGMHSPSTEPGNAAQGPEEPQASASVPEEVDTSGVISESENNDVGRAGTEVSWIDGAIGEILKNLQAAPRPANSLKILSHALPSTSTSGHIFSKVIGAIHISTPVSPVTPLTWINVFHAIPGRFNLADLPTSPPNTPGPPVGGDDYFTQKVFDSAVSILDYQDNMTSLPRSPRPVVPPSSIDVSIVERYIPPSSSNEFVEMFDPNGSSILVDRLVELSPDNGSLLFIYPTRDGAQTFMREYLGPILDPLLRTMVVVNGVSSDLCISLGNMRAVHQLLDHDSLRNRIAMLCARLTQGNTASQRFHGRTPNFSLSHASKQKIKLQRGVWAREWWTKQEKTRLKQAFNNQYQESQLRRGSSNEPQPASSTVLLQQLLDGVAGSPKHDFETPNHEIEVSVFVVTRSE